MLAVHFCMASEGQYQNTLPYKLFPGAFPPVIFLELSSVFLTPLFPEKNALPRTKASTSEDGRLLNFLFSDTWCAYLLSLIIIQ